MKERTVPAKSFCGMLEANVDNKNLSDEGFREFVRNSITIVIFKEEHTEPESEQLGHP